MQAQEAVEYYNQNVENGSIDAENISGTEGQNNTRQYSEEKNLRVSVDEDYPGVCETFSVNDVMKGLL